MMSILVVCYVLLSCFSNSVGEQIPFIPCENEKTVSAFYITPCNGTVVDSWMKCSLLHGDEVTIEASFTPTFDSSSLQTLTLVTLDGFEVATPYSGYDPCYGSIVPGCPVEKGVPYLFTRNYRVQSEFAVGATALKLVIRDMQTKEVAGCAKVPIVINPNPAYYYE